MSVMGFKVGIVSIICMYIAMVTGIIWLPSPNPGFHEVVPSAFWTWLIFFVFAGLGVLLAIIAAFLMDRTHN